MPISERQKEIEALEKKVADGRRRLKELLSRAEDLHSKSESLRRELQTAAVRKAEKDSRVSPHPKSDPTKAKD